MLALRVVCSPKTGTAPGPGTASAPIRGGAFGFPRPRSPLFLPLILLGAGLAGPCLAADGETIVITPPAKDLDAIRELVRTHLTQLPSEVLEQAAVEGLLSALGGRARLVPAGESQPQAAPPVALATNLFEPGIVQLRVGTVADGLPQTLRDLAAAGEARAGLVLDLRNAGGEDWRAAAAVADLFDDSTGKLLSWGAEGADGTPGAPMAEVKLAVLTNKRTSGAAEALAELLRLKAKAILIGSETAGELMARRQFPLPSGAVLDLALDPVQVTVGEDLPGAGIRPDIASEPPADQESAWLADPYWQPPPRLGISPRRAAVMNEAELMRRHRGETNDTPPEVVPASRPPAAPPAKRTVTDPQLARALDLLKGVRILARGPAASP